MGGLSCTQSSGGRPSRLRHCPGKLLGIYTCRQPFGDQPLSVRYFFSYYRLHCFICRPSDSTVPTDARIEPRIVATGALAVRRSNQEARSHPILPTSVTTFTTVLLRTVFLRLYSCFQLFQLVSQMLESYPKPIPDISETFLLRPEQPI